MFDDGHVLYDAVVEHGLEGIVAKRRSGIYRSGYQGWTKIKNPNYWRRELGDRADAAPTGARRSASIAKPWPRSSSGLGDQSRSALQCGANIRLRSICDALHRPRGLPVEPWGNPATADPAV